MGHLSTFPCGLLPEYSEELSSTAKDVSCRTGTKSAALCQEKAPADGLDQLWGQGKQSPQTHLYIAGARDTRVLYIISSLMSIMQTLSRISTMFQECINYT